MPRQAERCSSRFDVDVCPGTYAEQVTISKPLALKGICYSNSCQAVIAMPSGGLATTSSITVGTIAAQVEITAGPVNITNIRVDGAASTNCPSVPYFGIFYSSGSSGTVNDSEVSNEDCGSGSGNGILAENGPGATQTVTIEYTNINNYNNVGVWVDSNQERTTLNALIKDNYMTNGTTGISLYDNVGGSVTNNFVVNNSQGMFLASASSSPVSGNVVVGGNVGVFVAAPVSVTSNKILNTAQEGIYLSASNATVNTNTIVIQNETGIGIDFNCSTGNVTDTNTINGAAIGFDEFPGSSTGTNKFYNVATDTTGCS